MTVPDTKSEETILVKVKTVLLPDVVTVGTVEVDEPESSVYEYVVVARVVTETGSVMLICDPAGNFLFKVYTNV